MNSNLDLMMNIHEQKVQDWMREATMWRQLKEAYPAGPQGSLSARLLGALGYRLTQLGIWLQKRSGQPALNEWRSEKPEPRRAYS